MRLVLDHLVIAAASLEQGLAWCEATLGIVPAAGGRHALMSTHNRVFSITDAQLPRAYAEIIAIDPDAAPAGRRRWFDLDDAALQTAVALEPRLVHWVARCDDISAALGAVSALNLDRGCAMSVSRPTAHGELRWQMSLRDDGQRLLQGTLPTLIEWTGDLHAADHLPDCGMRLERLRLTHPDAALLQRALAALGLEAGTVIEVAQGDAGLQAQLHTPKGRVELRSGGV